jgi:hypothetical protein
LIGTQLIKKAKIELTPDFVLRIKNMARFTAMYSELCEEVPLIGDNDSGLILELFPEQASNNHRYLNILYKIALDEIAIADNYDDYLSAIQFKKTTMIGRHPGKIDSEIDKRSQLRVCQFDGIIIGSQNRNGIIFNVFHTSHGHTHNDKLAVYPIIKQKPLFIDRGTFSYTGNKEKRHIDRQSRSHNGPVINGWEQNKIWENDAFYINEDANTNCEFKSNDKILKIIGWHDGYKRFRSQMKVFRQIVWDFDKKMVTISDWVESSNNLENYQFTWNYLVNPYWKIGSSGNSICLISNKKEVDFKIDDNIDMNIEESTYCPKYMQEKKCILLKCKATAPSNTRFNFTFHY